MCFYTLRNHSRAKYVGTYEDTLKLIKFKYILDWAIELVESHFRIFSVHISTKGKCQ